MYIKNLLDLPVSKTESRFDLALYLEISVDLQVAWEKLLQDYKQFKHCLVSGISMCLPITWYQVIFISDFDPGMCR